MRACPPRVDVQAQRADVGQGIGGLAQWVSVLHFLSDGGVDE